MSRQPPLLREEDLRAPPLLTDPLTEPKAAAPPPAPAISPAAAPSDVPLPPVLPPDAKVRKASAEVRSEFRFRKDATAKVFRLLRLRPRPPPLLAPEKRMSSKPYTWLLLRRPLRQPLLPPRLLLLLPRLGVPDAAVALLVLPFFFVALFFAFFRHRRFC